MLNILKRHKHYIIEKRDHYKGYDYVIIFGDLGYRCAYIVLPNGKPKEYDNLNAKYYEGTKSYNYWKNIDDNIGLPGGLTFLDYHHLDLKDKKKEEFCIGWDYIHSWNKPDYDLAIEVFPERKEALEQLKDINKPIYDDEKKAFITLGAATLDCLHVIDDIVENNFDFYDKKLFEEHNYINK